MANFIFLGFITGSIAFFIFYILYWANNKIKEKHNKQYPTIVSSTFLDLKLAYIEVGVLLGFSFIYGWYMDGLSSNTYFFIFPFTFYILGIKIFFFGQKK